MNLCIKSRAGEEEYIYLQRCANCVEIDARLKFIVQRRNWKKNLSRLVESRHQRIQNRLSWHKDLANAWRICGAWMDPRCRSVLALKKPWRKSFQRDRRKTENKNSDAHNSGCCSLPVALMDSLRRVDWNKVRFVPSSHSSKRTSHRVIVPEQWWWQHTKVLRLHIAEDHWRKG